MGFALSQKFAELSDEEQARIQKRLGVILKRSSESYVLKKTIYQKLLRYGKPSQYAEMLGGNITKQFSDLLDNFGALPNHYFADSSDLLSFINLPYVVQDYQGNVRVICEAVDLIMDDIDLEKRGYLIHHLHHLTLKEKHSWAGWLGLIQSNQPPRVLTRILWKGIAQARLNWKEPDMFSNMPDTIPGYLDEIFPADDSDSPLYWFYKQVVPFYRSLSDLEKKIGSTSGIKQWITLFKLGFLTVKAESQGLGLPVRWKIITTREVIPALLPYDLHHHNRSAPVSYQPDSSAQNLFFQP